MKASTGRGTEEWETRESSSAAIWRAVFPKSTCLLMLMLVSLSMSDNFRICAQKPSLPSCSRINYGPNSPNQTILHPKRYLTKQNKINEISNHVNFWNPIKKKKKNCITKTTKWTKKKKKKKSRQCALAKLAPPLVVRTRWRMRL